MPPTRQRSSRVASRKRVREVDSDSDLSSLSSLSDSESISSSPEAPVTKQASYQPSVNLAELEDNELFST